MKQQMNDRYNTSVWHYYHKLNSTESERSTNLAHCSQGQRSQSDMLTFVRLIERDTLSRKTAYSGFELMRNFLILKLSRSNVTDI